MIACLIGVSLQSIWCTSRASHDIPLYQSSPLPDSFPPNVPCPRQPGDQLLLRFRKYARDSSNTMHQGYLREKSSQATIDGKQHEEVQMVGGGKAEGSTPTHGADAEPSREGCVESIRDMKPGADDEYVVIVSGLFSQEEDIRAFAKMGMEVRSSGGAQGLLRGPFGKTGKCKVAFPSRALVQVGDQVFVEH